MCPTFRHHFCVVCTIVHCTVYTVQRLIGNLHLAKYEFYFMGPLICSVYCLVWMNQLDNGHSFGTYFAVFFFHYLQFLYAKSDYLFLAAHDSIMVVTPDTGKVTMTMKMTMMMTTKGKQN